MTKIQLEKKRVIFLSYSCGKESNIPTISCHSSCVTCCHFTPQQTIEPTDIRTLVLRGLPIILGDNPTDFYKAGFVSNLLPSQYLKAPLFVSSCTW